MSCARSDESGPVVTAPGSLRLEGWCSHTPRGETPGYPGEMDHLASPPAADGFPTALTVALANDYEVVVQGLEQMLSAHADRIRVVELDVNMPVGQAVDVTLYDTFSQPEVDRAEFDRVLGQSLSGRVVIYTWNTHADLVRTALSKGVAGYLSKTLGADDLVSALERIHRGEVVVLPPRSREPVRDEDLLQGDWPGRDHGLTAREAEVVALITQGLTNQDIAARSYLSINSVKSYIRSAYRKMGVDSRSRAVLWGIEHGMTPDRGRMTR